MDLRTEHILSLLKIAAEKAETDLEHSGLYKLSAKIEEGLKAKYFEGVHITQKYLYETHTTKPNQAAADGKDTISLNKSYANTIARYAGFEDIDDYLKSIQKGNIKKEIPSILLGCVGNWYSYVRDSTGKDILWRSPVRIFQEEDEIKVELIGGTRTFYGTIGFRSGGIFFLLRDTKGQKEMHEVYKVGIREVPDDTLSGVFSALSSDGNPVAGRKVLFRVKNKPFEALKKGQVSLPHTSDDEDWPQNVLDFFEKYEDNYIMVSHTRVNGKS